MRYVYILLLALLPITIKADPNYFARFSYQGKIQYGQIIKDRITPVTGDIFSNPIATDTTLSLDQVELLTPTEPQKVFAVGMNFASHIASSPSRPPPLFLKLPTSVIASGKPVKLPPDARNVHFEGELVLVIGKKTKNISEADAAQAIYGVTVGNDLTERSWQGSDLQWMRAKASDGFGPVGPVIARNIDYNNVLLTTRLNGQVVQQENTRNMIHKPARVVSYLSQYFTLMPGDLIFMGTPGRTKALTQGDKVSVTIEQVGTVENVIQQ
ncbi:MAG: fumarylacetoacetate hydrolase family protein [Thiolinea sp.]